MIGLGFMWIVVDCVIMVTSRVYFQIALQLKINGEIIRNIFTLYFL